MAASHLVNVCEKVINGIEGSNAKSTKLDAKRLAEN